MIDTDRDTGEITFRCDVSGCTGESTYDSGGVFGEAWTLAKADGWKTQRQDDGWFHACPEHR